jgi:hypothetical protein
MISLFFVLFSNFLLPTDGLPFKVVTASGDDVKTAFPQLSIDGKLTLKSGSSLASREWYAIRREGVVLPAAKKNPRVFLENGDVLVVKSVVSDGTRLSVQLILSDADHTVEVAIPMSAVKGIKWANAREMKTLSPVKNQKDTLVLLSGDSVRGNIHSIVSDRVRIQVESEERLIELSKIQEIRFNEDLLRSRKPSGRYLQLKLASGTRISLQNVSSDQKDLTGQTLFKNRLTIPIIDVIALEAIQGIATSLADIKPTRYDYRSYDGEKHSWMANLSLAGTSLQLSEKAGISTFDRGLGLHSGARLTYSLGGKYRRLDMLAGLDPTEGRLGNAVLKVYVDSKLVELPDGGILTPDRSIAIRVNLEGAKEMILEIDPGEGGFVQDYVNLAQTLLIAR